MKRKTMVAFSLLSAFIMLHASLKPTRPPSADDIEGAWIGYTDDNLIFLRLELAAGGKGYCTSDFIGPSALSLYSLHWFLKGRELLVDLAPSSAGAEPIAFNVKEFRANSIVVGVGSTNQNWSRNAVLWKENALMRANDNAKRAIQAAQ